MTTKKYAFICSGGGVPAVESIGGMIDALRKEHDIIPSKIWACSGGTIPAILASKRIDILSYLNNYYGKSLVKFRGILRSLFTNYMYDNANIKYILKELLHDEILTDVIVNATDKNTRATYYLNASIDSVLASMSVPEVFKSQRLTMPAKVLEINYETNDEPRTTKYYSVTLNNTEVIDGGIYDNIPVPPNEDLKEFNKVIILLCSDVATNGANSKSKLKRSLYNIFSAYEREFTDIIRTYSNDDKFMVLRPPKIDAPLLEFSKKLCCYHNAYNYVKSIKGTVWNF